MEYIKPYYPSEKRGRPPKGIEKMLRMYLLQCWFNLSDQSVEDAIYACAHLKTAREQLSPGRFSPCCIAHRARMGKNLAKYNVALVWSRTQKKKIPDSK